MAPGLHLRIRHQSQQLVRLVELVVGEEEARLVELVVGEEEVRLVPLSHTVVGELQMDPLEEGGVCVVVRKWSDRRDPLCVPPVVELSVDMASVAHVVVAEASVVDASDLLAFVLPSSQSPSPLIAQREHVWSVLCRGAGSFVAVPLAACFVGFRKQPEQVVASRPHSHRQPPL